MKLDGNNQVLTTENREEMVSLVLTRITEAGWAGARPHRWTPRTVEGALAQAEEPQLRRVSGGSAWLRGSEATAW